jgi:hypothetical protein
MRAIQAIAGGQHPRDITFTFDVTEVQWKLLQVWSDWEKASLCGLNFEYVCALSDQLFRETLLRSMCITLGCYSQVEVNKILGQADRTDLTGSSCNNVFNVLVPRWPQKGGLIMRAAFQARPEIDISLAPPLKVSRYLSSTYPASNGDTENTQ